MKSTCSFLYEGSHGGYRGEVYEESKAGEEEGGATKVLESSVFGWLSEREKGRYSI